jgi:hypothetical protein
MEAVLHTELPEPTFSERLRQLNATGLEWEHIRASRGIKILQRRLEIIEEERGRRGVKFRLVAPRRQEVKTA